MSGTYDYIIVGGGSAGCVLANRLSSDRAARILLIEAGDWDRSPAIHVPAGLMRMPSKLHWSSETEPDDSCGGRVSPVTGGRGLGGTSSVNGMVWVRGNRCDFDQWAELGATGWDYDSVVPHFRAAERWAGEPSPLRGTTGAVHVGPAPVSHPLSDGFMEAAAAAGHVRNRDYNGDRQHGVAWAQTNQRRGFRHSAARAYLGRGVRHRRNLTVHTGAVARRVLTADGRAVGVEYVQHGEVMRARATREVVLAAGALRSPLLLMRSGIGPAEHLAEHGIDVVVDNSGVGRNLQDHSMVVLGYASNVPTMNELLTPGGVLRSAAEFAIRGTGAAASAGAHCMLFADVRADSPQPDIQAQFAPVGIVGDGAESSETDDGILADSGAHDVTNMRVLPGSRVCAFVLLLHPRARGSIELGGAGEETPLVRYELAGDPADVLDLTRGCQIVRDVMRAAPLDSMLDREILPGAQIETDQDWASFVRRSMWHCMHLVGTCSMAGEHAVVDASLRVRGLAGLRVADASVMPSVPSGNTLAPTVMVAEKAAAMMIHGERADAVTELDAEEVAR